MRAPIVPTLLARGLPAVATNGGTSLRFSKADNTTPLPYQIESWSPTTAAIRAKVDTINGLRGT